MATGPAVLFLVVAGVAGAVGMLNPIGLLVGPIAAVIGTGIVVGIS